jgi:hypothetical protein
MVIVENIKQELLYTNQKIDRDWMILGDISQKDPFGFLLKAFFMFFSLSSDSESCYESSGLSIS